MNKMKIRLAIILLILVCGIFALAQDAGITPTQPSISICGNGLFTITVDNTGATEITGAGGVEDGNTIPSNCSPPIGYRKTTTLSPYAGSYPSPVDVVLAVVIISSTRH